jgi:rfaE bifunctional protein kinase chain/domain
MLEIFKRFENVDVLVVGDVMLDRYWTGRVSRISPEAPVPVVEWESEEDRLGGAANVALNLKALGATPWLCGFVGQERDGEAFFQLLPKNQLEDRGIIASKERVTTVKTRVISNNQHLLRLDKEQRQELSPKETSELKETIRQILETKPVRVIILQDYNKGVLTPAIISWILETAAARHIPVAVDPKALNFWEYKNVALFKPNLKEVREALNLPVAPEKESLRNASVLIRQKLMHMQTLITLSEKGVFLDNPNFGHLYATAPRNVADVSGAGDTVISVAALGLSTGLDAHTIAILSNLAGGQVVERVGVVPVDRRQLMAEYEAFMNKVAETGR